MEFLVLYLFVMLEQISSFLSQSAKWAWFLLIGVTLVWAFVATVVYCDSCPDDGPAYWKKAAKVLKPVAWTLLPIVILCGTIGSLLPTPKQAAIIFAGGYAYQAVTSEDGKRVLGKLGSKVEQELSKMLSIEAEVKPEGEPK